MFKSVLVFLFLSLPMIGWSSEGDCYRALSSNSNVVPIEMTNFWSTLDAREQRSVVDAIDQFLNNSLRPTGLSPDAALSGFTALMERMLTGHFRNRPLGWDVDWLIAFLREIETHPDSDESIKSTLSKLQLLVATHEVRQKPND